MPLLKSKSAGTENAALGTIAKAVETPTPAQTAQVAAVKSAVKKAAASEVMTKAEWSAKDRRISRQGLFQSALNSVGLLQLNVGNTLDDFLKIVEQAADRGLEYVNRE